MGVGGLATCLVEVVADGHEAAVIRLRRFGGIEVVPTQSEQFVAAHPGERRHPQSREEAMPGGGPQEDLELVGGPRLLLDFDDEAELRRVGDRCDGAGQEPPTYGVGERAADDEVEVVHGLGGESEAAVGGVQEPVVDRVEVLGSQLSQPDGAEAGEDVRSTLRW
jgi:hypothetical protein